MSAKMKLDYGSYDENGQFVANSDSNVEKRETVKLSDAMNKSKADNFDTWNLESKQNGMGDLFERVTVPAT